jgi:hypothetical protein
MSAGEPRSVPDAPLVLEYAKPWHAPRWFRTVRVLLWIELFATAIAAALCVFEVETIVASGPALFLIGVILLIFGSLARRPLAMVLGGELMCVVIMVFLLINLLRWSPGEARVPVSVIACLQTLAGVAVACVEFWRERSAPVIAPSAQAVEGP